MRKKTIPYIKCSKRKTTLRSVTHPPEVIDVDPEIIEDLKKSMSEDTEMTDEEKEKSDAQDFIER